MCKVQVLVIPLKFPAWELASLYKCLHGGIGRHVRLIKTSAMKNLSALLEIIEVESH